RRIVHAHDLTGRAVEQVLIKRLNHNPNIWCLENQFVVDLMINKKNNQVSGVIVYDKKNNTLNTLFAHVVVLATGGCGQVYQYTTNPAVATGDGLVIAQRAGAKLKHMEFIQFHPTVLNLPNRPHFLLSESLRGEGAVLRNARKQRFMPKYDKRKDLAPRDIVSRAIVQELKKGVVYLDITSKAASYLQKRFPHIYQQLKRYGLRLDRDLIPIAPAAHYSCGGIITNLHGQTSIKNLYAVGEVACTGVQGANRLASNSLLECLVFAEQVSKHIKNKKFSSFPSIGERGREIEVVKGFSGLGGLRHQIQTIMWETAGIIRNQPNMKRGLTEINKIIVQLLNYKKLGFNITVQETLNIAEVSRIILTQALSRKTSVGAHYVE
ncbi:MAG: FAD-binding protein, partial [Patescibacteria group bacterium]